MPGSRMESDWQVGGRTYFIGADNTGMVTTIQKLDKPYEVIFEQLGEYKDGQEILPAEGDHSWDGALEGYKLEAQENGTLLRGYVDTDEQYEEMMTKGFQKGFEELAQIAAK